MASKNTISYNYSIVMEYRNKYAIPMTTIEVEGVGNVLLALLGIVTVVIVVGLPLSLFLGSWGFILALGIAIAFVGVLLMYLNEINYGTGRSKLSEFYYTNIKKYRSIYDERGEKHYIEKKQEGVIWYNAHRNHIHL